MPLDGFDVIAWASQVFGGLPPIVLGGFALVVLGVAIALFVSGARMVPTSWALLVAGAGCAALAYFIVGEAVSGAQPMSQNEHVAGLAPRAVPIALAAVACGLGGFSVRAALRSFSREQLAGKLAAALFLALALVGVFVGVQIVRGAPALRAHPPAANADEGGASTTTSTDQP